MNNHMELLFPASPKNEAFARVAISAFTVQLSPTLPEMADVKTAVSEAVTNAIVHGYGITTRQEQKDEPMIRMTARYDDLGVLTVTVEDGGRGIPDVELAMQPFYSTGDEGERSGMGFCVMQTFMDHVTVDSTVGKGTTVTMVKRFGQAQAHPVPQAGVV